MGGYKAMENFATLIRDGFFSNRELYIFGAGRMGEMVCKYLYKNHTYPRAFIVSGNPRGCMLMGLPVVSVRSIENTKHVAVIIATLTNLHAEIIEIVEECGFSDYYALTEDAYFSIRDAIAYSYTNSAYAAQKNRVSMMMKRTIAIDKRILVISDFAEESLFEWANKITFISSKMFMKTNLEMSCFDIVFSLLTNWNYSVKDYLYKLFGGNTTIALSFRSVYTSGIDYDLNRISQNMGYRLESMCEFRRPLEEYEVEDTLYFWEKNSESDGEVEREEQKTHYDIGLVGCWSCKNYGDELTYFALYKVLKKMGYSVLMIEWPENSFWKPYGTCALSEYSLYEADEIADLSEDLIDMYKYNLLCDMFVVGSGQLLNPFCHKVFQKPALLVWSDDTKKRVIFSQSFGTDDISEFTEMELTEIKYYLGKADSVFVRENSATDIMKNTFDVNAEMVLDPVFLCEKDDYEIIKSRKKIKHKRFLFAYILDFDEKIADYLTTFCENQALELVVVTDPRNDDYSRLSHYPYIERGVSLNKFLTYISEADYIVTDSFHGTCMAIIYEKQFISLANYKRGVTRFESILSSMNLKNRLIYCIEELQKNKDAQGEIDYESVRTNLIKWKKKSLGLLKRAISEKKVEDIDYSYQELRRMINFLNEKIKRLEGK